MGVSASAQVCLSDGGNDGPSDMEELRLRTVEAQARIAEADAWKETRTPPRRLKPPRRSPRGSLSDDALSDPGSDVSEPSLLSTPSRADPALEALQQREEELRRREVELQRSALQQRRLDLERSTVQRREDEVWQREQEMLRTPRRVTPRRVTPVCQRPSNRVVRRTTRDFDLAVNQRVQYLSIDQGRWVGATVTRLNNDLSVDLTGDDGIIRRNYHVFRNGRRVIR
jgi:hypothetical protein